MRTTATGKRRIGAKIILLDDGTVEASVFLIEADGKLDHLGIPRAATLEAIKAIVHAHAAAEGVPEEDIDDFKYEDTRAASRGMGRPLPGKTN